ncbi:hypothetical protein Tsubulata_022696 [Turnera subulata]|uniref:K Homology domain-containing protein n=1 Tax=Turnera subulata TaxID=218843 RepID=A0A9Q0F975_9ROSI|nr:hypothetical protein Tsubulata_022696 [Turnera subulata]
MSTALTPSKRPHDRNQTESNGRGGKSQKTGRLNSPKQPGCVVFRVLCPLARTGGVIGKGGAIISQIRQETGAKVRVEDTVPGCDERVVVIASPDKEVEVSGGDKGKEDAAAAMAEGGGEEQDREKEEDENKESGGTEDEVKVEKKETPSLQRALFLVFERIVEAEPEADKGDEENDKPSSSVFRLLVLSSQVGCLLGKAGSVIKQTSAESGAQIRILPRDKLPACASASDELVQIAGEVEAVKKALKSVSQQLLENPPRDQESFNANSTGPPSHTAGHALSRAEEYPPAHPRAATYASGPRNFHETGIPGRMKPSPELITFRLLCHDDRVGGVIGKGGTIIKSLKQETGCEIKVMEAVPDSEDRVVIVSGPAHPDDRVSPAQDAVLRVQSRIARVMPDGKETGMTSRLLVPSNHIGCLLGKGGSIMAEMRKSSGAYIRILGKDQVPKCASENEEVVQINGDFEAVQEALVQITSRLQHHFFRELFASMDHPSNRAFMDQVPPFPPYMGPRDFSPPFRSFHNFDVMDVPPPHVGFRPHDDHAPFMHNIHRPGLPPHVSERKPWGPQGFIEGGAPMGLPDFGGPPQRRISGFGGVNQSTIITSTTVEVIVPRSLVPVIYGEDGACLKQIREFSDANIKINDPKPGAAETFVKGTEVAMTYETDFLLDIMEAGHCCQLMCLFSEYSETRPN